MRSDLIELEVCVHGKPVREYPHQNAVWIEGRKGSPYTIRLRNRTWGRVLVVLSVDGLSVMTGKPASKNDGGYVLSGSESLNLPGWYLNDHEVAKFVFGRSSGSYAAKTGQDEANLGIIGCAVFKEESAYDYNRILRGVGGHFQFDCVGVPSSFKPGLRYEVNTGGNVTFSSTCVPNPNGGDVSVYCCNSSESQPVAQELGTEFGKAQDFKTRTTSFTKESETPTEQLTIRYDSRQNLKRRGIELDRKPVVAEPNPFPADVGCQPPADWRR